MARSLFLAVISSDNDSLKQKEGEKSYVKFICSEYPVACDDWVKSSRCDNVWVSEL